MKRDGKSARATHAIRVEVDEARVRDEELMAAVRKCGGVSGVAAIAARARVRYNEHRHVQLLEALSRWALARGAE